LAGGHEGNRDPTKDRMKEELDGSCSQCRRIAVRLEVERCRPEREPWPGRIDHPGCIHDPD
jgi:hypothetical protein